MGKDNDEEVDGGEVWQWAGEAVELLVMDISVLFIFVFVYMGMVLGEIPGLAIDRTGIALIGAIAYLAMGHVSLAESWHSVDVPTMALLFGMMVLSGQFRLSGFYAHLTKHIAELHVGPRTLLAILIGAAGVLSALLVNDIICLAMTPLLVEGTTRRKLNPVPYLLGLACASNVGSAATLIGNPQNMLIGQTLRLSFTGYLADGVVVSGLGLVAVWAIVAWCYRNDWHAEGPVVQVESPPLNRWQSGKGAALLVLLVGGFMAGPVLRGSWPAVPREVMALTAAGILLLSRKMSSRNLLGQVDWQLLVLFFGLFVVNHALAMSGWLANLTDAAIAGGIAIDQPGWLFAAGVVLSNLVSNVPAVMLLLPVAHHEMAGPVLALSSTLAGNLFIVGSIANIIVVDQAGRLGVKIGWWQHARVGVPVTAVTLGIAAGWLWIRAGG